MDATIICAGIAAASAICAAAVPLVQARMARHDDKADKDDKIIERLDGLDKKIDNLSHDIKRTAVVQSRVRILRFGDEVIHGTKHSQDHFQQTLKDVSLYEAYCADHPEFKNEITVSTIALIKETYAERLRKNDFL